MADLWTAPADNEVWGIINNLIGNHHPHLAGVSQEIVVIFREKASKSGGKELLGKTSKVSKKTNAIAGTQYAFEIEIAYDKWLTLDPAQRTALIDHHLCAMQTEEDEQTLEIKCSVRPPDVFYFHGEIERHGDWRPREEPSEEGDAENTDDDTDFL